MDFWDEIDELRHAWDVLEHPVYQRLQSGSLSWAELAACVGQYRFVIDALADAAAREASDAPGPAHAVSARHARERRQFVRQWEAFAREMGAGRIRPTLPTVECADIWRGPLERSRAATQVTLYAVQSAQPAITAAALRALDEHYGSRLGPAVRQLAASTQRDRRHAAAIRRHLDTRLELRLTDTADLLSHAEAAYSGHWDLLEGCLASMDNVLGTHVRFWSAESLGSAPRDGLDRRAGVRTRTRHVG
jgi:pyrroloquinoline quinone (PQQ) biosynthesis protein C